MTDHQISAKVRLSKAKMVEKDEKVILIEDNSTRDMHGAELSDRNSALSH